MISFGFSDTCGLGEAAIGSSVPASVSRCGVWLIDGVNCTVADKEEKHQNMPFIISKTEIIRKPPHDGPPAFHAHLPAKWPPRATLPAAARVLDMSPAVVTRLVVDLEEHLGTRLIQRTTRRMVLTEAGRLYLEQVEHILDAIDEADAPASAETDAVQGMLRLHAPPVLAVHILAPLMAGFHRLHPRWCWMWMGTRQRAGGSVRHHAAGCAVRFQRQRGCAACGQFIRHSGGGSRLFAAHGHTCPAQKTGRHAGCATG